jgi:hypothetical protein
MKLYNDLSAIIQNLVSWVNACLLIVYRDGAAPIGGNRTEGDAAGELFICSIKTEAVFFVFMAP